jgi:hypothetical protein
MMMKLSPQFKTGIKLRQTRFWDPFWHNSTLAIPKCFFEVNNLTTTTFIRNG